MHNPGSSTSPQTRLRAASQESPWVRYALITAALAVITVLIIIPVVNVFWQALAGGIGKYFEALADKDTRHAILLTLSIAPTAVVANVVFGLAAAWAVTRFRFPGRTTLVSLIDLPFAVSPVAVGLMLVLIFGLKGGYLGEWLAERDVKILFAWPAMVMATMFVTLPFVARELIPIMEAIGSDEETAAISLGASGWQMFWRITLPNIKWGLLYGVILCNARAMGEFGAVYVVSGRITGQTDTMPLRVGKLFEDGMAGQTASFALASVLTLLALVTLIVKVLLERKTRSDLVDATRPETGTTL